MNDLPIPACPLCSRVDVRPVQDHPDFPGAVIHECEECGFWFAHPPPSAAALETYYRTTYARRRSWSASREYLELMRRRAAAQREFIDPELRDVRRSLDVGCGVGALVAELQGANIDAIGYDTDESVIEIGRRSWGANIHPGHHTRAAQTGEFDLLCLSHVVEHFAQPTVDLKALAASVRSGGWIFVEVPNCVPWMFEHGVDTESHLGFFTSRSLRRLGEAAGLEVVRLRNCGPPVVEHYQQQAAQTAATRSRGLPQVVRTAARRVHRLASRLLPVSAAVRTEYDGFYDRYYEPGDERGMWLRALFRQPVVGSIKLL